MSKLILPGLIDPHVHLRDPGQTNKEDFYTGTCAALAGGYTTILDMPNNKIPITTSKTLNEKIKIAKEKIVADAGFYFGSLGDNLEEFKKVTDKVLGLKLYLNQTTGNFLIDKTVLKKTFEAWKKQKPILIHAEDKMLDTAIKLAEKSGNKIHICHISTISDLKQIMKAKEKGLMVTCGVTPHHLFLTENDVKHLGPFGLMKPSLKSRKDQEFLWKNLKFIDVIESDHAPHTIEEKIDRKGVRRLEGFPTTRSLASRAKRENLNEHWREGKSRQDPKHQTIFGVPGLETTLPLLLTSTSQNRLKIDDIVRLCHTNPAKIFNIKTDPQTKIEIDLKSSFIIGNSSLFTKCKWTPFEGTKVKGKLKTVWIRGKKVFENGKILARPGSGKIIKPMIS